jgi:hypothetical protein
MTDRKLYDLLENDDDSKPDNTYWYEGWVRKVVPNYEAAWDTYCDGGDLREVVDAALQEDTP